MWIAASKWQFKLCFLEFSGKKNFSEYLLFTVGWIHGCRTHTDKKGDWIDLFLYSINGLHISYFVIIPTHLREGEKKSENVYLKEKTAWESGSEEKLGNESTVFKQVNIKQTDQFLFYFSLCIQFSTKLYLPFKCALQMSHFTIIPALFQ